MEETSFNLQTFIDVRKVAMALLVCDEQGVQINTASDLGRQCISVIASRSAVRVESTQQALDIIGSHGLSVKQLERRGNGIRKALTLEDDDAQAYAIRCRADKIAGFIERSEEIERPKE